MTRILRKIFGKFLRKFFMIAGRLQDFRPSFAGVHTWNQKCTGNHVKEKVSARIKDNSFFPYKIATSIKTSLLSETWNFAPIISALLGKTWALPTTQNRIAILGNLIPQGLWVVHSTFGVSVFLWVGLQFWNPLQITESHLISGLLRMSFQAYVRCRSLSY